MTGQQPVQVVYVPYYPPAPPPPPPAPAFTPEAPPSPTKRAARDINRMTVLCFAQMALSAGWGYVFGLLFVVGGIDMFAADGFSMSMLTAATLVLSTGVVPFVFFTAGHHKTADYLKFQKVGFFPGLLCVLAGSALMLLANFPAALLREALEGTGYQSTAVETSAASGSWLGFAVDFAAIAVLGPMMEEIMDRGIILTTLRRHGLGFAAVASGVLFGLNHLDLCSVVFATLAGLVLGFVYARTNNLWLTIWMHMINNGLAVIGDYGALFCPQQPDLVAEALYVSLLGLGLISLILVLTWKRKIFLTRRSPQYDGPAQSLGVGQSLGAMARSPMVWVFAGLVGAYFALLTVL